MNEFKQARADYEATPIPEELASHVQAGIRQGRQAYWKKGLTRWAAGTAACLVVLVGALNLSPTVAAAAADIPVLGGLFRVMTFVSYSTSEDGINYVVSTPKVEADGELARQVNAVIQEKLDAHLARARQDWEDYQTAFFATGGTEEEWAGREMDVIVDYEIKSQTDTRVSFVVTFGEGWVSAMEESYYYNLDLAEDRTLTLRDILGEDWVERCNAAVQAGIDASVDGEGFTFFFPPEEGGFTAVDENTTFYIREDGVPVVTFPRYSIAAGAAGIPEFPVE